MEWDACNFRPFFNGRCSKKGTDRVVNEESSFFPFRLLFYFSRFSSYLSLKIGLKLHAFLFIFHLRDFNALISQYSGCEYIVQDKHFHVRATVNSYVFHYMFKLIEQHIVRKYGCTYLL